MGCLVSSVVKMEQIHPDLSLHTEMYMSEQLAISTDRMMISSRVCQKTDRRCFFFCITSVIFISFGLLF